MSFQFLIHFFATFPFDPPKNIRESPCRSVTFSKVGTLLKVTLIYGGFLLFSRGSKSIVGIKRVKIIGGLNKRLFSSASLDE